MAFQILKVIKAIRVFKSLLTNLIVQLLKILISLLEAILDSRLDLILILTIPIHNQKMALIDLVSTIYLKFYITNNIKIKFILYIFSEYLIL